tara:strand:+ start:2729 stop:3352 length:624 start_codon:yes stop_codon:yes gene_type:complete
MSFPKQKFLIFILLIGLTFINPNLVFAAENEAVLAGGCFWCLEHDLEQVNGIKNAESGYAGGDLSSPTYDNHQGHQESVLVDFDPSRISYDHLLRLFIRNVDPLDGEGQFCDRGDSYRPVIFVSDDEQRLVAKDSLANAAKELSIPISSIKIAIKDRKVFWPAENYHQDYAEINSLKYNFYRYSCGRDSRLKEVWGSHASSMSEWVK